ncbi:S-layer homology domain-containing protein [Lysinibacillus odysseyi]|uniref:S-layer homology domain-containing protein n=1 Tax=Lysinibacillus odysseyi TaxID=202611 RepID=UPI00068B56C2|nr:S-layer homology domain-containing protein [Lysinibacillus odysseyi]
MKLFKFLAVLFLTFQLVSPAAAMTGNRGEPAHYLALGDSLAAGMIETGGIGTGYADVLAQTLKEAGLLASYNKGFAVPGYTTEQVLDELNKDVKKPSSETGEKVSIVDEVKKADVITISVGANDVLKNLKRDDTGKLSFDPAEVQKGIVKMVGNYDAILKHITQLNPTADVFVMGYYNPFPHVTELAVQLNMLVGILDTQVNQMTEKNGAYFVKVADILASDTAAYLPNPENIHPSEEGYKAIAEQFTKPVLEYINLVPLPEVKMDFTDIPKDSESYGYAVKAAEYGLMNGYKDGTFKPYNPLTRVQMTSILTRALELEATSPVKFTDLLTYPAETQQEVAAAAEAGIVKGIGQLFKPADRITRAQMALMIQRAYEKETGKSYKPAKTAPFTDISTYSSEYKEAITFLYDKQIASGVGSTGKFNPTGYLTRAQAAKIISNFYEQILQ